MREACKLNVQIHNGNILVSSVTKDPEVSSILLFSGSSINFPRPLYFEILGRFFRIGLKSVKKILLWLNNFLFTKFEYVHSNSPEIYADFETVEKNSKIFANEKVRKL